MISVIIPIYNSSDYLFECLKSIRDQSFTDFEVLMIDDGSIDNSKDVCLKFLNSDNRFRYFYQSNKGVSFARNKGIELSKGEYLSFIDADDQIDVNYFEELFDAIQKYDFVVSGYRVIEKDKSTSRIIGAKNEIVNNQELCKYILTNSSVYSFPWNRLYKSSILDEFKIRFDSSIHYGEDLVFNLQYCQHIKSAIILASDNYNYVQHESSASSGILENLPESKLHTRIDDITAMEVSLKLLPNEYDDLHYFLYLRLMREGSTYYRLMRKYKFPIKQCNEVKDKVKKYLHIYLKSDNYRNKKIKSIIKAWLNLNFPTIINMIK